MGRSDSLYTDGRHTISENWELILKYIFTGTLSHNRARVLHLKWAHNSPGRPYLVSAGLPRSLRRLGRHVGAAPQTSRKWRPPATETRGRQRRRSLSRFWPSGWTSARRRTPSPIARSQPTSPPSSPRYAPPASARPSLFDSSRWERNHAPSVASAVNSQF